MDGGAWWAAVHRVTESRTRLSDFTFTFPFHALEKEMASHSSVLAWRIPGTGEPGGLPSMVSHRVGHDWSDLAAAAARKGWSCENSPFLLAAGVMLQANCSCSPKCLFSPDAKHWAFIRLTSAPTLKNVGSAVSHSDVRNINHEKDWESMGVCLLGCRSGSSLMVVRRWVHSV